MKVRSAFSAGVGILLLGLLYNAGTSNYFWAFKHGYRYAAIITACALIPILAYFLMRRRPQGEREPGNNTTRIVHLRFPTVLLVACIGAAMMWLFRQKLILPPPEGNGDGIFLLEQIPVYTELFGFRASFDEILELFVHSKFYLACKSFGISVLDSYAILSCFSGFLYVNVVLHFLNGRPFRHWILGSALFFLSPAIQLFFGYVEHYDTPTLLIAASALLALRMDSPGHRQWILLGVLAALGAAFHMIAGIVILPLAYYCWIKSEHRTAFIQNGLHAAIPAAIVLGAVWVYFLFIAKYPIVLGESFFVKPPFYPWREVISVRHFLDTFNLLFLGIPALLCVIPFLLLTRPRNIWSQWQIRFALLGFAAFLLASFVIHPLLGYPADWDLFTIFQIYGNVLLFELLLLLDHREEIDMRAFLPGVLLVCLISTVLWIGRNHQNPEESQRTLDRIISNSNQFLQEIKGDQVFAAAPQPRKKTVVQVKLFMVGARNKARKHQDQNLAAEIEREARAFDQFILLPEAEYRAEYPVIWGRLTDLNRRMEELSP